MIYLDHNAATPIAPEVREEMLRALEIYGNPSSLHEEGQKARSLLDESRAKVAAFIGAFPDEIIFTSGGTEANNIAVHSFAGSSATVSAIEHSSVLKPFEYLAAKGVRVHFLPADSGGIVSAGNIPAGVSLVSVMLANNDTGVIQPVRKAAEAAHTAGALFHTDAVQAAGKIRINVREFGADILTLSAHKMYAPKGIGALFVRRGLKAASLMQGGSQEKAVRPGTESTVLAAAFAKACETAEKRMEKDEAEIARLRAVTIEQVTAILSDAAAILEGFSSLGTILTVSTTSSMAVENGAKVAIVALADRDKVPSGGYVTAKPVGIDGVQMSGFITFYNAETGELR
ncbi:MAG: aminotransferase class V-fold PLP-dependent enzyme, partial [Geovibrio sp.]|nr:aminotransferase class V-fold PLP-dependent enzyme [Geovibrio sp.]